jgi:hypothetical protein
VRLEKPENPFSPPPEEYICGGKLGTTEKSDCIGAHHMLSFVIIMSEERANGDQKPGIPQ